MIFAPPIQNHQPAFPGAHGQLGAISEAGFFQHVEDVRLDGRHGHVQSLGDLLIGIAAGHFAQHLQLAVGEFIAAGKP